MQQRSWEISRPSLSQPETVDLHPEHQSPGSMAHLAEQTEELASTVILVFENTEARAGHLADYIGLLDESEKRLVKGFDQVRNTHSDEPDVESLCKLFSEWSKEANRCLSHLSKYGERQEGEPSDWTRPCWSNASQAGFDMLRDFHDLWLIVNESMMSLKVLEQAARALRDTRLLEILKKMQNRNERQLVWLKTRINQAAPQVLVVPLCQGVVLETVQYAPSSFNADRGCRQPWEQIWLRKRHS